MKLLNFNVIKLTICLVLGILIAFFVVIPTNLSLSFTLFFLLLTAVAYFNYKRKHKKTIWFGIFSFATMLSIGILVTNFNEENRHKKHYTQNNSEKKQITLRIRSTLKSSKLNNRYIVDILKIDSSYSKGKALLNVYKTNATKVLKVDDVLITNESFNDISSGINPYQFNYQNYLAKQYVYKQLHVKPNKLLLISQKKHTVFGYADSFRNTINKKLKNYNFHPDVLSIINALILGQRQNLSKTIYNNYANAGAVHILAVSGLHVAIILSLLSVLFLPLKRFKHGKNTTIVLLVTSMWCFAIIAGLSASVTRAVTMFSIIAIAMHLKRPTNIYNTLAVSVFVILLFKPLLVFDVGFQLSYAAVLAIVAIQPRLDRLWQPKNIIISKIWTYFTVGVAAQIGVLPISLYYFHQFPGLFFVANVVVIPFLGLILGLGILVITLALLNILPSFLIAFFSYIIWSMNHLMQWLSLQERFLFQNISFSIFQVFTAYILIITFIQFSIKQNFKWLRLSLVSVLLFQGSYLHLKYKNSSHELVIFHKSKHSIIGKKKNTHLKVFTSLDSVAQFYNLKDYKIGNAISKTTAHTVPSILRVKNRFLLVIDSVATYQTLKFKPDYILLTQSPKLNIKRLIDSIKPKVIIADGSNYKSYVTRWKATCKAQKTPFYYTGKKGAYIFNNE